MIRRPPRSTLDRSSAASDVYKRQGYTQSDGHSDVSEAYQELENKSKILGYCFYHGQDLERAVLGEGLFLTFGTIDPNADKQVCLLYTSPSPRDRTRSRMPSSA